MTDTWVDGNALAGMLRELFAVDVTAARCRCASCGRPQRFGEARVFERAPGAVARCLGCEAVLLRVVRAPGRMWLDLTGVAYVEVAMPDAGEG
jgi:hypothetical protein